MKRYLTQRTPDDANIGDNDFIVSFNSPKRIYWDTLILLMAMWNCIETPLSLAFGATEGLISITIINYTIDLFFYLDIMIAFRTSILTYDGQEVKDAKEIAKNYIFFGTFVLDFFSVFPFDDIIPGDIPTLQLLRLLKLIRIRRLPELIKRLDMHGSSKAVMIQVII